MEREIERGGYGSIIFDNKKIFCSQPKLWHSFTLEWEQTYIFGIYFDYIIAKKFFFDQVTIFKDMIWSVDYYVSLPNPKFPYLPSPISMNSAVQGPDIGTKSALHPQIHIKSAE